MKQMRDELKPLWDAINKGALPAAITDLFGDSWDPEEQRFQLQETYLIDFKDRVPTKFAEEFGASIVRLVLGFHNTYGGVIVFGVSDGSFAPSGLSVDLDIETLNRTISDVSGKPLECLFRRYKLPGTDAKVGALLVPRRGAERPIALQRALGPYKSGTVWVRERHEVLEATPAHLPLLYSSRLTLGGGDADQPLPIHKSLPPSPATMHNFIGRQQLMKILWDWFVFGDQPRMYLHGPGGSGKSTLAYEFAKTIADVGFNIVLPSGDKVDYVLFLSAKETELNPVTGEQQQFTLRQFEDAYTEFKQILYHSGHYDPELIAAADDLAAEEMLADLFSSYCGLIVLDDIDALSRRKVDTGEETLLLAAVSGSKRTRILYTLRYPPSHARRNAPEVPGLNDDEFYDFLEACCEQFEVSPPPAQTIPLMQQDTQSLPLLLETVVGLRRICGSFNDALALYHDKGGDEARSYLYQREYDQLDPNGKSREIMAALLLLEEPVHFNTLTNLLNFAAQKVADALSECGSIFLTTSESASAETLYQLTPPSRPFIRTVSQRLDRFSQIERKVELLRKQGGASTPAEAAVIIKMQRLLRQGDVDEVILLGESFPPHDPCLANPVIHALLGQAYANKGPNQREKARECFRHASGAGLRDTVMMRAWYYLETRSGYGLAEAERICGLMIESDAVGPRYKSEFLSKLAYCHYQEARSQMSVSREKAVPLFQRAIGEYLEAAWIAQNVHGMDATETLNWLERPVATLLQYLRGDLADYLTILENLPSTKHDVNMEAARLLIEAMTTKTHIPNEPRLRNRLAGLFRRASSRLDRFVKGSDKYPGLSYLADTLGRFSDTLGDSDKK